MPLDPDSPPSRRVATRQRIGVDFVDVVAAVAILSGEFFEILYAVNDLAEVRAIRDAVNSVHFFTNKTRSVNCSRLSALE